MIFLKKEIELIFITVYGRINPGFVISSVYLQKKFF